MSENTPKSPQESEPQSPAPRDSRTSDEEKSIGAEAIVNAPPTAEISDASDKGPTDESADTPMATEAGQFRTAPMD
ncbi:MAG: histidine kinase, partial [Brevibacterium sp.]|nr:histidine kinase [Brevibacterium sp.]